MNIKDATEQIEGAIRAYLSRDEHGLLRIPFRMQRPIIMLGPPGVGKTAVVAQIAEELDINFVSYSITHHTRQSALGLPFIAQEEFEGESYSVSEYTMSEIIASVYDYMAVTGRKTGILFPTRSTASPRRSTPRCCNSCSSKRSDGIACQTDGSSPAREIRPHTTSRCMISIS